MPGPEAMPSSDRDGSASELVVEVRGLVAGGAGIGVGPDGRVVLVDGALPGEQVGVVPIDVKPRMVRGTVGRVLAASPHRVEPACPLVASGCGGCDLQYAAADAQPKMKVGIVRDALAHLGRLPDARVDAAPPLAPWGYRTTVRALVDADGVLGLRRRRTHDVVSLADGCPITHPLADEVLRLGRFPGAREVTVRVGVASGERTALVEAEVPGVLARVVLPDDVAVMAAPAGGEVSLGPADSDPACVHEEVAGRLWEVSAPSFFQSRPDGAAALVDLVAASVDDLVRSGASTDGHLVDAYAGVGLFAGALRDRGWRGDLTAVEVSPWSVRDATHNLTDDEVVTVCADVAEWRPRPAEIVVADPARSGLGAGAVATLASTGAMALILVSCDAAALGRDAALLTGAGYRHDRSTVLDLFPHTHHVEVVSTFIRSSA